MTGPLRPVLAVALADFRERSRSTTFLVVPLLVAYFVKIVTVDSTLVVGTDYTGRPTIAWLAGMTTVIGTTVLVLFGFSLVKDSIGRDLETGVSELVAPSSLSNGQYLLGKWLSNVAVLAFGTLVLLASTGVASLFVGVGAFDPWALVSPFLLITLPAVAAVAAVAVCFETIGPLRGTAGTVIYFLLALTAIVAGIAPDPPLDLVGLAVVRGSMAQSIAAQYPAFDGSVFGFTYTDAPGGLAEFTWAGIAWTGARLVTRLPVLAVACGFLGVAWLAFDRFDDSTRWSFLSRSESDRGTADDEVEPPTADGPSTTEDPSVDVDLAPVSRDGGSTGPVLLAELRMALRGYPRWWYAVAVLAVLATAVAPIGVVRTLVVPLALLLPLSAWSALGTRERRHRTTELVFVGSRPTQLLGATYASGVAIGLLVSVPAAVRFALSGMDGALVGWLAAVLSLPAIALALGVWTGRSKSFEIAYLTAWYLGPVNGLGALDYVAARPSTASAGIPVVYLALTVVALGAALVGRRRQ
ncbi:ABC transporter permease [Halomicrobium mukohataei]|uniref:ABC transporter permease n=1 Tax=Halomicrobium mukohataei TaxID=57705 RepID=UPI00147509C5|nr:ABC transporter permease [Halomicrobium mukohataei]